MHTDRYQYTAVFDPDEKGGYTVTVPALPGLVTEGDTFEEAKAMVEEAIGPLRGTRVKSGLWT
jgi:predicted RNase H-like HicB family nuclease